MSLPDSAPVLVKLTVVPLHMLYEEAVDDPGVGVPEHPVLTQLIVASKPGFGTDGSDVRRSVKEPSAAVERMVPGRVVPEKGLPVTSGAPVLLPSYT